MIFTALRYTRIFAGILLLALTLGAPLQELSAQEPDKAVAQEAGTAASEEDAKDQEADQEKEQQEKKEPEPITESQRLKRLEQVIELDQNKIAETKKQLAGQEAFFDELSTSIEKATVELEEMKGQLEEMGGAEASDEATALASQIQAFEEQVALGKAELEVRFNSVKTLKGQIQALEKKIATDQQALETLISPAALPPAATPAQPAAAPGPVE